MKIVCGCLVLMKREKCDGVYSLIGNMVINSVSLTLTGNWKEGARNNKRLYKVSFSVGAETCVTGF